MSDRLADQPDSPAYIFIDAKGFETTVQTRSDVAMLSEHIALTLARREARPTLIVLPAGPSLIMAFIADLRAKALSILCEPPVRGASTKTRLENIIQYANPRLAIVAEEHRALVEGFGLESTTLERLLAAPRSDAALDACHPSESAYLQFTSGSTGAPKGTCVSFGALADNLQAIQASFGHDCSSKGVIWLPPYHDMGLVGGILQPLHAGFPVVLIRTEDFLRRPRIWLQAVSRYRATTSEGPTFGWKYTLDRLRDEDLVGLDLSCWDLAFVGAEPINVGLMERFAERLAPVGFRRKSFLACYGLAEATLFVTGTKKGTGLKVRARTPSEGAPLDVSCGRPWRSFDLRIVEQRSGRPLAPGEIGEIWIRGPSLAPYHNCCKHASIGRLMGDIGQGFLRTGDLGYVADGELYVTGRARAMIKVSGRKIFAEDIETIVQCAVKECVGVAAFSGISAGDSEQLVVVIETRGQNYATEIEVSARTAINKSIGILPNKIIVCKRGTIPRTVSGKIDRSRRMKRPIGGDWAALWLGYYRKLLVVIWRTHGDN